MTISRYYSHPDFVAVSARFDQPAAWENRLEQLTGIPLLFLPLLQLLNELQVLRDKIIQVSAGTQNPEGEGGGGGLSADKELLEIFKREIDRNQDHELSNSQFKIALGYTTTLMKTVCQVKR